MKGLKQWMALIVLITGALAGSTTPVQAIPETSEPEPGRCDDARVHGLEQVNNDNALASALHTRPEAEDSGHERFELEITQRLADDIKATLAAGCRVSVVFTTRVQVGVSNAGRASSRGTYFFNAPGNPVAQETIAGSWPLQDPDAVCGDIWCEWEPMHEVEITDVLAPGSVITLSSDSLAWARVEKGSTSNTATGIWDLRYPVLVVPVPLR